MKNSCKQDFVNEVNEITLNCDIFVFKKNCVNHLNSAQRHFKWTIMSTWPQYFYAFSKLVACGKKNKKNKFNAREEQIIWTQLIVFSREKIIYDRTIHSNHYLCTCRQKLDFFMQTKKFTLRRGTIENVFNGLYSEVMSRESIQLWESLLPAGKIAMLFINSIRYCCGSKWKKGFIVAIILNASF